MIRILFLTLLLATPVLSQGRRALPNFERRTPIVLAVENVGPSVVNIQTQGEVRRRRRFSWFQDFEDMEGGDKKVFAERSLGSGVIVHPDGLVITNEHVIRGADRIQVRTHQGETLAATLINSNTDSDLAVLRLPSGRTYAAAQLGDSDSLLVGETTMALGNPFGLSNSVTDGILSATGRSVRFRGREVFSDFLQTSALINPGNSGGPLLDINGRVIGVNVAIDNRGPGIGYAIPINRVREVMTQLLEPEITKQASLGLEPRLDGARLVATRVTADGPAAHAGLRAGDHIVRVAGRRVSSPFEFNAVLQTQAPGTSVPISILRNGRSRDLKVPFSRVPLASLARGGRTERLGMLLADMTHAIASRLHIPDHIAGPIALEVKPGSPAAAIDLRKGDVILQVDLVTVPTVRELTRVLDWYRQRRKVVRIRVYRENAGLLEGTIAF